MYAKNKTGVERIELPPKVLETPMIPFHHTPKGDVVPPKLHTISSHLLNFG